MDQATKQKIINNARIYLNSGWHCSEGVLLAAGEHYFPDKLPELLKVAAPFSGGIGGTNEGMCGALSGGLIVIGAYHGRTDVGVNDDYCVELGAIFREKFLQHFANIRCADLRENWIGKPGQVDCAELTAQAVGLLVGILENN